MVPRTLSESRLYVPGCRWTACPHAGDACQILCSVTDRLRAEILPALKNEERKSDAQRTTDPRPCKSRDAEATVHPISPRGRTRRGRAGRADRRLWRQRFQLRVGELG